MPDEPIGRPDQGQYIASGAADGAMPAARRLSEAVGVGLDEVLAAVQGLRSWESASVRMDTPSARADAGAQLRSRPA